MAGFSLVIATVYRYLAETDEVLATLTLDLHGEAGCRRRGPAPLQQPRRSDKLTAGPRAANASESIIQGETPVAMPPIGGQSMRPDR